VMFAGLVAIGSAIVAVGRFRDRRSRSRMQPEPTAKALQQI
jgi:hypothetical protein